MSTNELSTPLTDHSAILAEENTIVFPSFTSEDAFNLGCLLKRRIPEILPQGPPAAIHISLATGGGNVLFHAVTSTASTSSYISPDNDIWVQRKKETVMRWGCSTYALHFKFNGLKTQEDVHNFDIRFGKENLSKYCLFGGGFPVRVRDVEGVVAVIVVSGLKHFEDHGVIVKVVKEYLDGQKQFKK